MKEITTAPIRRWQRGGASTAETDDLATEEPLEIRVDGRSISVTMRTPGRDDELAVGFLLSEGLIKDRADVREVAPEWLRDECNIVDVRLADGVGFDVESLTRHVFASSSCGVCGKASIDSVHLHFPPITTDVRVSAETLLRLPEQLGRGQETFRRTGGLHAAAIFDLDGKLIVLREDVGRHNAVDKVLGYALLEGLLPFDRHVLLVSGRASFEIMQRALAARVPIVAAVSAPSSLAAQFAHESHQVLVGFVRGERMNLYAGSERVQIRSR